MTTYEDLEAEYAVDGFSGTDALFFCQASHLAYAQRDGAVDATAIEAQTQAWGFDDVEVFEVVRGWDVDTQGYVAYAPGRALIAFRGTESGRDWRTNLQTVTDPGPWYDTRVHEGFQDAFAAVALRVGEIVGRVVREEQEIWITGHSLGGALAVLLAATLCEADRTVAGLYTYAAPRVGDVAFASRLDEQMAGAAHWRVANAGDLVPHLPPQPMFCHAGNRVLLMKDGRVSHREEDWKGMATGMWRWIRGVVSKRALNIKAPHSLEARGGYLERLTNSLDSARGKAGGLDRNDELPPAH